MKINFQFSIFNSIRRCLMLILFRPFRAQPSFKSISSQMKFRVYSCLFVDKKEAHNLCASTLPYGTPLLQPCFETQHHAVGIIYADITNQHNIHSRRWWLWTTLQRDRQPFLQHRPGNIRKRTVQRRDAMALLNKIKTEKKR